MCNHNKDFAQRRHLLYEPISRLKLLIGALRKHDHLRDLGQKILAPTWRPMMVRAPRVLLVLVRAIVD